MMEYNYHVDLSVSRKGSAHLILYSSVLPYCKAEKERKTKYQVYRTT